MAKTRQNLFNKNSQRKEEEEEISKKVGGDRTH
jgi:hypothetical protein